jgi:hypothetical protein
MQYDAAPIAVEILGISVGCLGGGGELELQDCEGSYSEPIASYAACTDLLGEALAKITNLPLLLEKKERGYRKFSSSGGLKMECLSNDRQPDSTG